MKITDALRAEHAVFHNLFDHLERTLPRLKTLAEVKAVAAPLEAVLAAHSAAEDVLLIAPLEHCLSQLGQQENFHREHEEIDALLRQVRASQELKQARKLFLSAVAYSRTHFDKEERILFPLAEKVLKPKTLTTLGADWFKQREAALD